MAAHIEGLDANQAGHRSYVDTPIEKLDINLLIIRRDMRTTCLDELANLTKFTKKELRVLYRGFKSECPDGIVNEDSFISMYSKFFPYGDCTQYVKHVFKAFDLNNSGQLTFKDLIITLSTILKGSVNEKLAWIFDVYDLNRHGFLTQFDVENVLSAVNDMQSKFAQPLVKNVCLESERIFKRLDVNFKGVIYFNDFLRACQQDPIITQSLSNFSTFTM